MIEKTCQYCGNAFFVKETYVKRGGGKYCNSKCFGKAKGFKKGAESWNLGIKMPNMSGENHPRWKGFVKKNCINCDKEMHIPMWRSRDETRGLYCSPSCRAKYNRAEKSPNWKGGKMLDKKCEVETCFNMVTFEGKKCRKCVSKDFMGEKNAMWKGGLAHYRENYEYREWRSNVFKKDKYTCLMCGIVGKGIQADHIKPYSLFPELRTSLENGQTLCRNCHIKKTKEDWKKYNFMPVKNV